MASPRSGTGPPCARGFPSEMAGHVGEIGPPCETNSPFARQGGWSRVWEPATRTGRRAGYRALQGPCVCQQSMLDIRVACPEQPQLHRPAVPCFVLEVPPLCPSMALKARRRRAAARVQRCLSPDFPQASDLPERGSFQPVRVAATYPPSGGRRR